eukprot:403368223
MQVRFRLKKAETRMGENLFIVGNIPSLSNWNARSALPMNTDKSRYPQWDSVQSIQLNDVEALGQIEYKYIIKQNETVRWEDGKNRVVNLQQYHLGQEIIISDQAFNMDGASPQIEIASQTSQGLIIPTNQTVNTKATCGQFYQNLGGDNLDTISEHPFEESKSNSSQEIIQTQTPQISQNPRPANQKQSDTLAQDIISQLQSLNAEKGTWKQKLEIVAQLVEKYKEFKNFPTEGLAILAAYLYFVNSHQIKCAENGTHFRPNNHANIAYDLYRTLDNELTTEENSFIIRSLKKNLPSFADQFTQTVPLTRIRDIAHRNDIPSDLKSDIKNRLQNKLHRCADPGDLKTCEELIQRVRNGNYSGDFKNQFEIFYEELKEFFNAMGLDKLLSQVKNLSNQDSQAIEDFIGKKNSGQINEGNLQILTSLRKQLKSRLSQILGDHNQKTLYQYLQLADIELEQFLFVKLSEILSPIQQVRSNDEVKRVLRISQVAIENMILSGLYQNELSAVQSELTQFGINNQQQVNEQLSYKRLKSSTERALRLGKGFTSRILDTFQTNVLELGKQFGIDRHAVEVFSESFVRSHIIFQFSKSLELVTQYLRKTLNLPPFIVISQGQAQTVQGNLKYCHSLYDLLHVQSLIQNQQIIVLLETADGTEEIPSNVIGVLLKHDLPQLSHLAIRARQSGCIFVSCENDQVFNQIHSEIQGSQFCKMILQNEAVKFEKLQTLSQDASSKNKEESKVQLKIESKDLSLLIQKFNQDGFNCDLEYRQSNEQPEVALLGSKSVNSLKLQNVSKQNNPPIFSTPQQTTVPMTLSQYILMKDQDQFDKYQLMIDDLDEAPLYMVQMHREKILKLLNAIYSSKQDLLDGIADNVQEALKDLPQDTLVAVRSSSTLEDLSKMAGAGLFDSYLNITLGDREQLINSITDVWLSLFTERAIISRKQYNIPSSQAQMSVLIQQQIHSDFSFIIHTQNPMNNNQNEIYIEVAVGLGETLASANQQGTPYRLCFNKTTQEAHILSFANYSMGLFAQKGQKEAEERLVDYGTIQYSQDPQTLIQLGKQLGQVGQAIESSYGGHAQDIEGAIVYEGQTKTPKIYVVQTRNQI